jgi:hypothetical protein
LKERILAAGYENADIDSIGINALPGANVDKVLTEEGESCATLEEKISADLFPQLGDVFEVKSRASSAVLGRRAYSQRDADERKITSPRLNSVIPISCSEFFQCNGYTFPRSLKFGNFFVSESFWILIEIWNQPIGSRLQHSFPRASLNGWWITGTDIPSYFPCTPTFTTFQAR